MSDLTISLKPVAFRVLSNKTTVNARISYLWAVPVHQEAERKTTIIEPTGKIADTEYLLNTSEITF
jgi:hypothetical protein